MKKFLIFLSFLLTFFYPSRAQQNRLRNGVPKVVVGIIVENMHPDYIARFWDKFQEDGFKKLASEGIRFTDVKMVYHSQNYASGMATLFTGTYPMVHGIIEQTWYDSKAGKMVNCISDEKYQILGGKSAPGYSPHMLKSLTLADQLKMNSISRSRVYSIAMNPSSALFPAGFSGDAAWWFDVVSGNMVTSTYYLQQVPEWVNDFNRNKLAEKYAQKNWALLNLPSYYVESGMDNDPTETGYGKGRNVFPHNLSELIKEYGDFSPLKTTPYANSIIREFTSMLLDNEPIGQDEYADLITVTFSSMDFMNNSFGPASVEIEDLYLRMDQEIALLVNQLEKKWGKENCLIFLTSDMTSSWSPEYLKAKFKFPAGIFYPEKTMALLNSYLNLTFGELPWITWHNGLQLYLDHHLAELNKIEISHLRSQVASFVSQFEGIETVMTADNVNQEPQFSLAHRAISHSFFPGRSGDVLFTLMEGWQPAYKDKIISYSDQYRIPLILYGAGIKGKLVTDACESIDLVPTLLHILNIPPPNRSSSRIVGGL